MDTRSSNAQQAQQVAWLHVPRFTWRVESTRSHYRIQECANWSVQHHQFTREVLGACISAHMIGEKYYNSPCAILSLTGSLLWALNYAHWLLSQGRLDIQIFLVDAWEIPKESISPAGFLAAHLEVAPLDIPWHDDPYHEYFVFGHVPSHAILGSVGIESAAGKEINTLLPGFGQLHPRERLHESLGRLQRWTNVWGKLAAVASVTDDEIWAAGLTARKFLRNPHPDVHFEITMMFLALRKRDWSTEVWWRLLSVFKCVRIPSLYMYRSRTSEIESQMPDVVEWVNGMEAMRLQCAMVNARARSRGTGSAGRD